MHEATPFRVGLTGGIASGKTTVANTLAALGARVIDTDAIAREAVAPGQAALAELEQHFGGAIIRADGSLDRRRLREMVFADAAARHELEAILHPRIRVETLRQADAAGGLYQVIVVPLLTRSELRAAMDRILLIDCRQNTQIQRLVARDAESAEQARRILKAQASRREYLAIADDVIDNSGTLAALRQASLAIHRQYLERAGEPRKR